MRELLCEMVCTVILQYLNFATFVLNPLTTNAESYSDLPEIFTTDFSNFLKNKMFLHEFFPPGVTKI